MNRTVNPVDTTELVKAVAVFEGDDTRRNQAIVSFGRAVGLTPEESEDFLSGFVAKKRKFKATQ